MSYAVIRIRIRTRWSDRVKLLHSAPLVIAPYTRKRFKINAKFYRSASEIKRKKNTNETALHLTIRKVYYITIVAYLMWSKTNVRNLFACVNDDAAASFRFSDETLFIMWIINVVSLLLPYQNDRNKIFGYLQWTTLYISINYDISLLHSMRHAIN